MLSLLLTITMKFRRWNTQRQLKWLEFLDIRGIGFRTRVLEIIEERSSINGYKRFCIRALLRVNGKIECRKVHGLLKADEIPHVGDRILIHYLPDCLNHVVVNYVADKN